MPQVNGYDDTHFFTRPIRDILDFGLCDHNSLASQTNFELDISPAYT